LLVILVGAAAGMHHVGLPEYWTVPLVPPLILGLAYNHGRLSRLFSTRALIYGGKVSFALYMTQRLWLWVVQYVTPPASYVSSNLAIRASLLLWSFLPMLVAAAAVYHVVEEPARRRMMRGLRPLRSRTAS
jgi:peptidoglycan/LPS O-acetylase OafA/YrhL